MEGDFNQMDPLFKNWRPPRYENLRKILILIEDDPEQLTNLARTAYRYFGSDQEVGVCMAANVSTALVELNHYHEKSPDAMLIAVLDYNMGLNDGNDRRPTETLFRHNKFQHFLRNGGIIVIYSGFPEQVIQSPDFREAPDKYENLALLLAEKGQDRTEDVLRILYATTMKKIPRLREVARKYKFDLGKIIEVLRGGKRA